MKWKKGLVSRRLGLFTDLLIGHSKFSTRKGSCLPTSIFNRPISQKKKHEPWRKTLLGFQSF